MHSKAQFDPYHKWLGIPPRDQPPDHYRLLGVERFEPDLEVIETAANQRMAYLHGCSTGEHAELAEQLLNEISRARVCLLNPTKRAAYDDELRGKVAMAAAARSLAERKATIAAMPIAQPLHPVAVPVPRHNVSQSPARSLPAVSSNPITTSIDVRPSHFAAKRRRRRSPRFPLFFGVACVLGVPIVFLVWQRVSHSVNSVRSQSGISPIRVSATDKAELSAKGDKRLPAAIPASPAKTTPTPPVANDLHDPSGSQSLARRANRSAVEVPALATSGWFIRKAELEPYDLLEQPEHNSLLVEVAILRAARREFGIVQEHLEKLPHPNSRDRIYAAWGRALAQDQQFEQAKAILERIASPQVRIDSMLVIAQQMCASGDEPKGRQTYESARNTATSVSDRFDSVALLIRIAESKAYGDKPDRVQMLNVAANEAALISNPAQREGRLGWIASTLAEIGEGEKALSVAASIQDVDAQQDAFCRIVQAQLNGGDFPGATASMQHVKSAVQKASLSIYLEIAAGAQGDLGKAQDFAMTLPASYEAIRALAALADAQFRDGQYESARLTLGRAETLAKTLGSEAGFLRLVESATRFVSAGKSDQVPWRDWVSQTNSLRATALGYTCVAFFSVNRSDEGTQILTSGELGPMSRFVARQVACADVEVMAKPKLPDWIVTLPKPLDRAFAYLGCADAALKSA